jgi:hypothetical protein
LVYQHLDQLLHVERVTLRASDDELAKSCGYIDEALQQLVGKQLARASIERTEIDAQMILIGSLPFGVAFK